VVDFMYAHPRPRLADAVIRGLEQAGIRALVARGFITRGTEFGVLPALVETIDEALADCERLVRRYGGDASLLRIGVAPCLLWMISEDDLRATRAFADQFRTPITYHLAETSFETSYAERTYRMPETDVLSRAGLLGPDLLAAHCTKLSRRDIRMLRNFDVKVSHNPISNMYLGAGIAPVEEMVSAGISVGLATDGPASNNNQNMVQVLKAAALLHKVAAEDATAMTAEKVLEMATIDGARCIGLEREIGSIEPGKRADIAVFSLSNPFIAPVHDPVSALVYAATGSEAVTVLVDGRVVMRDGSLTLLDERVVMDRAAAAAHGLAQRAGIGGPRRPWRSRGH